jgi:hypothetical protein
MSSTGEAEALRESVGSVTGKVNAVEVSDGTLLITSRKAGSQPVTVNVPPRLIDDARKALECSAVVCGRISRDTGGQIIYMTASTIEVRNPEDAHFLIDIARPSRSLLSVTQDRPVLPDPLLDVLGAPDLTD